MEFVWSTDSIHISTHLYFVSFTLPFGPRAVIYMKFYPSFYTKFKTFGNSFGKF